MNDGSISCVDALSTIGTSQCVMWWMYKKHVVRKDEHETENWFYAKWIIFFHTNRGVRTHLHQGRGYWSGRWFGIIPCREYLCCWSVSETCGRTTQLIKCKFIVYLRSCHTLHLHLRLPLIFDVAFLKTETLSVNTFYFHGTHSWSLTQTQIQTLCVNKALWFYLIDCNVFHIVLSLSWNYKHDSCKPVDRITRNSQNVVLGSKIILLNFSRKSYGKHICHMNFCRRRLRSISWSEKVVNKKYLCKWREGELFSEKLEMKAPKFISDLLNCTLRPQIWGSRGASSPDPLVDFLVLQLSLVLCFCVSYRRWQISPSSPHGLFGLKECYAAVGTPLAVTQEDRLVWTVHENFNFVSVTLFT